MKLSLIERQILYNQCLIMSMLDADYKDDWELKMKALDSGYSIWYEEIVAIDTDELSEQDCKFVYNVLDMYSSLLFSYTKLTDKTGISEDSVCFQGFDGNYETKLFSFASFLLKDANRWSEFAEVDCNSHTEKASKYRQMLQVYNEISPKQNPLSKDQIILITNA